MAWALRRLTQHTWEVDLVRQPLRGLDLVMDPFRRSLDTQESRGTRLYHLVMEAPATLDNLRPNRCATEHAFNAIVEHWTCAVFGIWRTAAALYVEDHYAGPSGLSAELVEHHQAVLTVLLAARIEVIAEGFL